MVGGAVIEIIKLDDKIWINTVDRDRLDDRCAIYVERNETSEKVKSNDSIWWQGKYAYWTPLENKPIAERKEGVNCDIKIKRIGCSGVSRPKYITCTFCGVELVTDEPYENQNIMSEDNENFCSEDCEKEFHKTYA